MHLLWATDGFGSGREMGKYRPSANHSLLLVIHSYAIPVSYPTFIPVQFHWLLWSRLKLPEAASAKFTKNRAPYVIN